MSLPKQVQRQLEEVEAMEKSLAEQYAANTAEPTGEGSEVNTETIQEPAAASAVETQVETPPDVVDKTNVVELKQQSAEEETWQQRYKSLAGKYNAEVPQLHGQNKELTRAVQQLQAEVDALKSVKTAEVETTSLLTDEEKEEFRDMLEVQRKVAKEVTAPLQAKIDALQRANADLYAQVNSTGSQIVTMSFEQKLAQRVPDFDALNVNPKWVAWLDEYDPMLRNQRRVVAQAAFSNGDVDAIADYVDMFRRTATPPKTDPDTRDAELRSQVTPNKGSNTPVSTTPAESTRVYTELEAGRLFDKVAEYNRQGKFEAANKLETELTAAYSSGRVR